MTGNDDNKQPRRNPWGQPPQNRGPWGQGPTPDNGGPDIESLLRQAKGVIGGGPDSRFILFAIIIAVLVWLGSGVYRVEPGENAVIKRFGAIDRTQGQPGLGYALPWPVETVTKLNVMLDRRTQVGFLDGGYPGSNKRDVTEESLMLTADANIVDIDVVVLWNITEAEKFLFSIRNPEQTIKRVAESALREAVGQTNLQTIITEGRDDVAVRIQKLMQSVLDSYKSGVAIKQVLIQEATVHPEVLAAYNDVAASRQDAERYQNEATIYRNDIIPKARGEAIQMKQQAEAYKQDVIARATGDAKRFTQILEAYRTGKEVTRDRFYIETMELVMLNANRVVLDQKAGTQGAVSILPLDIKRAPLPQDATQ
ncbi:MAG: FtsH protease activity modulator HflK [Proteobacteria bacterium]|nr:FtsH protease activity modulator HflK [Pseudomonadota bacterium]